MLYCAQGYGIWVFLAWLPSRRGVGFYWVHHRYYTHKSRARTLRQRDAHACILVQTGACASGWRFAGRAPQRAACTPLPPPFLLRRPSLWPRAAPLVSVVGLLGKRPIISCSTLSCRMQRAPCALERSLLINLLLATGPCACGALAEAPSQGTLPVQAPRRRCEPGSLRG